MHAQRLNITLPYEIARNLKRTIPAKKRSKFIANAIREQLPKRNLRKELIKSLKINRDFYRKVAEEWKATEIEGWPN
ncbi:hypothetical protein HYT74_02895 [Candidatus Daviesbacteria bacterium]|nr:hypothetical protein [Candidatus Daviesbacteria bacterium]